MNRAIGIDEIETYFITKHDMVLNKIGNCFTLSEKYGKENWRFGDYKQLKAFYLGFKYSYVEIESWN